MTSGPSKESPGERQGQGGRPPLAYAGMGFELAAYALAGAWGGYLLDGWLDTRPWLFVAGLLVGIVAGFANFLRRVWPTQEGDRG